MSRFWEELKARGVLRLMTAYVAVSWLVMEVSGYLFQLFDLPKTILRAVFVLVVIGVPIVATIGWYGRYGATVAPADDASRRKASQFAVVFACVAVVALVSAAFLHFSGNPARTGERIQPATEVATLPSFTPPANSVAVLSFANMSGDPKDEYFSDGLSEELLDTLVRIRGLQVAARTSAFSFKGTSLDIPSVARKLNVAAVLEGSVRRAGNRVRITTQLINAVSGFTVWSQTYDRDLQDVFAMQTEIAAAVAHALRVTLLGSEKQHAADGGTRKPEALDAYLQGKAARKGHGGEASTRDALAGFERALALDSGFALAHAERARTLAWLGNDWVTDATERERLFQAARAAADRALELAPQSGLALAAKATVLQMSTLDFRAIDATLRRALELEPGNAELLVQYSEFASQLGREDALATAQRAVVLDPAETVSLAAKSQALFYLRWYEEARQLLLEIRRQTTNYTTTAWLGFTEVAAGHYDAAIEYCEPMREQWYAQLCLALAYSQTNRGEDARRIVERMQTEQGDLLAFQFAKIHAFRGDQEAALHWLERALQTKDSGLIELRATPFLDSIRDSPRYRAVEARLQLPSS